MGCLFKMSIAPGCLSMDRCRNAVETVLPDELIFDAVHCFIKLCVSLLARNLDFSVEIYAIFVVTAFVRIYSTTYSGRKASSQCQCCDSGERTTRWTRRFSSGQWVFSTWSGPGLIELFRVEPTIEQPAAAPVDCSTARITTAQQLCPPVGRRR